MDVQGSSESTGRNKGRSVFKTLIDEMKTGEMAFLISDSLLNGEIIPVIS